MHSRAVQAVCELVPGSLPWPQFGPCRGSWKHTQSARGGRVLGSPRAGPSPWDCLQAAQGGAGLISGAASRKRLHLATSQPYPA